MGQLQPFQALVTIGAGAIIPGEQITWLQMVFAAIAVAIVMTGTRMQVSRIPD